ncbi:MAG: SDR family NAD(P)-dependent oxidoreductase [Bacteroidota bacterium]
MAKTWFITGISSGLGKALAEEAVNNGYYVIGTLRKPDQVDAFNERYLGRAKAVLADITDFKGMEEVISNIPRIDVLVNNAGIGFVGAIEETSLEETRKVFEANFFAALRLTQLVLPKMRNESSGHIVQISSHSGIKAFAGFGIYSASKFALEGFTEALAQEVEPLGIRVTLIEPGPFRTQFASKGLPEAKKVIYEYAETAGAFRNKLKGVHGKQEGDPQKAARVIVQCVVEGNTSLRIPLGKIPMATIQMKLDSVKSDLEGNRNVAEQAVFD